MPKKSKKKVKKSKKSKTRRKYKGGVLNKDTIKYSMNKFLNDKDYNSLYQSSKSLHHDFAKKELLKRQLHSNDTLQISKKDMIEKISSFWSEYAAKYGIDMEDYSFDDGDDMNLVTQFIENEMLDYNPIHDDITIFETLFDKRKIPSYIILYNKKYEKLPVKEKLQKSDTYVYKQNDSYKLIDKRELIK